jgi:hypothetical protein
MPFRKNSSEKTMNSQFLKQVFSNSEFLSGYTKFIGTSPLPSLHFGHHH